MSVQGNIDRYFSIFALFIMFRETVEASIIVSVLLQFLSRTFPHLKRQVWLGVTAGVATAITFGIIFSIVFYVAKNNVFTGNNKNIFTGCICWLAASLITVLAFMMLRYQGWETKIKRKLEALAQQELDKANGVKQEPPPPPSTQWGRARQQATASLATACRPVGMAISAVFSVVGPTLASCCQTVHHLGANAWAATLGRLTKAWKRPTPDTATSQNCVASDSDAHVAVETTTVDIRAVTRKQGRGLFLAVFLTVVREGIESIVFLAGVGNAQPTSLPLPGLIGILCGVCVGMFLYYTGRQVKDVKWFLIIMAVVLFFIAAGQFMLGAAAFTAGGMFGPFSPWQDMRPWYMQPQWDLSSCCSDGSTPAPSYMPDGQYYYLTSLYTPSDATPVYSGGSSGGDGDTPTGKPAAAGSGDGDGDATSLPTQKGGEFFQLAHAIVGYTSEPTYIQVAIYFGYWALVLLAACYKYWTGSLFDADYKYKREMAR